MILKFGPRNMLQIDDARICFRNFAGRRTDFNNEGDRNFALIIPNEDIKEKLLNDVNEYGAAWNVKIKEARNADEQPFMYMPVKVKYTEKSRPEVYLISGRNRIKLTEDDIAMLDDIDIVSVDLDIRPYDGEGRFGPHRTAYLQAIYVTQEVSRFAARFAEEEYPEE